MTSSHRTSPLHRLTFWALLALLALTACEPDAAPRAITRARVAASPSARARPDATSAERFGLHDSPGLRWRVPEGWTLEQSRPMRIVSFRIGAGADTECYVAALRGSGGGLEANVNRWRAQLGQPPLSADEIAALPQVVLLGRRAPLVEVQGDYAGMAGAPKPAHALLGTLCAVGDQTLFVKLVGPEAVVRAERERFVAFCASLEG